MVLEDYIVWTLYTLNSASSRCSIWCSLDDVYVSFQYLITIVDENIFNPERDIFAESTVFGLRILQTDFTF